MAFDYLHDFGGKSLVATTDASTADASEAGSATKEIADDTDAAVQLRSAYLDFFDGGAQCANLDASK